MPTSPMNSVIEHIRRAAARDGAGTGDCELLGRFIDRRDDDALAALVARHGPMVWGVCRRLLCHHDAEDAFQATFLVLVRKAASVAPRAMVGNWLYGVAHQTSLQARRAALRRRAREVQVAVMPDPEAAPPDPWPDVRPLLDQELSHLPDIYRAVVVLCDLEGRTRKEVARELGVPEGTVAGRLARGRALLAKRLTGRGVTLSGAALAVVLGRNTATASVPAAVSVSTIRAATAGANFPRAVALAEGVRRTMMLSKLRAVAAVVLVLGLVGTGAISLTGRTAVAQPPAPAPLKGEKLTAAVEKQLKWGEAVNGLRAAMAIRAAKPKDHPDLYLALQNVSKNAIRLTDADVPKDVNFRTLYPKKDGRILYGLGAREPDLGDRTLQPGEVTFLPLFDPDTKMTVPDDPSLDGHTIGSSHAAEAIKDARQTLFAKFEIEKAPAGAWTGKLVTADSTGAAAEIKSDPPPAGKK